MTLYTTDYLEYYLTLVAWVVNNGIWSILVASGVFALPFVAIVIQEWLKARSEGADEGNKGVLSSMRIENRVWVAIVVIMFAGIPFIPVDLATIRFDTTRSAQCQVSVPLPNDTGWSNVYTALNDQSALVPVWWFFMHALSKAVTGSALAAIPCGTDLRQIRMDVDATRIDDPVLAQEVADFTHDCYALKLRQSYLLPAGVTPEAQAAQAEAWTAGTAYAALLHDIGKIAVDLHVEHADGSVWHPWHGPLRKPYRFRYRKEREYRLHSAATGLLYARLLDRDIFDWLSGYPDLWAALLYVLAGQYEHAGTLGELVVQADQASVAQELGGDPSKALAAPKHALQRKLLDGLRYLLKEAFKLNQAGPADGWLTQDALWLVSKREQAVETFDVAMTLVAAGYGIAIAPAARLASYLRRGIAVRPLAGAPTIVMAYLLRRDASLSDTQARFARRARLVS